MTKGMQVPLRLPSHEAQLRKHVPVLSLAKAANPGRDEVDPTSCATPATPAAAAAALHVDLLPQWVSLGPDTQDVACLACPHAHTRRRKPIGPQTRKLHLRQLALGGKASRGTCRAAARGGGDGGEAGLEDYDKKEKERGQQGPPVLGTGRSHVVAAAPCLCSYVCVCLRCMRGNQRASTPCVLSGDQVSLGCPRCPI